MKKGRSVSFFLCDTTKPAEDFIKNGVKRTAAIRQLGTLDEKTMNKSGSIDVKARDQYFAKNSARFPALNSNPAKPQLPEEKPMPDVRQQFTKQPAVSPRVNTQQAQPNVTKPKYNYNNIQRAQSYHSGSWQQAQPTYQPAPRQTPARSVPSAPAYHAPTPSRSAPVTSPRSGGGIRR